MGKGSKIGWCDHTFNIVWGCEEVSPACDNCYARELDHRFYGENSHWGDKPRREMADRYWRAPLQWNLEAERAGKPSRVFCSSMADAFETHPFVELQRQRLWPLIRRTPWLRWLLLTKRASNVRRMLPRDLWGANNIWLGTTVESPTYLWRVNAICEVPAPVHFLSMEPLLEEIAIGDRANLMYRNAINWLITGCESGPKARPTPIDRYRRLRDDCAMYEVDFLFKQAPRVGKGITSGPGSTVDINKKVADPATGKIVTGIIEAPYLDGVQHMAFPAAA